MKVTIFFWVSSEWNDADEAWKSLSMNPEALQGLISAFLNYWEKNLSEVLLRLSSPKICD